MNLSGVILKGKDGTSVTIKKISIDTSGNTVVEFSDGKTLTVKNGKDGAAGKDGQNGKSAYDIWKEQPGNGNKTPDDFVKSLKGDKGDKGDAGKDGRDGRDGRDSNQGNNGNQGGPATLGNISYPYGRKQQIPFTNMNSVGSRFTPVGKSNTKLPNTGTKDFPFLPVVALIGLTLSAVVMSKVWSKEDDDE